MAFYSEVIKFSNHMFYVVSEKVYHRKLKNDCAGQRIFDFLGKT